MTSSPGRQSRGEGVSLSSTDVSVTLSPAVDTPTRTVTDEDDNEFTISEAGRVNPGDSLTVTVDAPADQEYVIEFRDVEEDPVAFTQERTGTTTEDFDTSDMPGGGDAGGELGPGSYAVVPSDGSTVLAIAPFVIQAYEITTNVQEVLESGDPLPVTADLDHLPEADDFPIERVDIVEWVDGGEGTRYAMEAVDDLTYEGTLTDPPTTPFNVATGVLTPVDADDVENESVGISTSHTVDAAVDSLQLQGTSSAAGRPQFSTPAVGTDRVFAGGLDSRVVALPKADVPNGVEPAWEFERAGSLSDSSPALSNGTVYVGSGGGVLYALAAGTEDSSGSVEWTYPADETDRVSAFTSSPLVVEGIVYVGANDGTLHAVDAASGTQRWTIDAGGPIFSQPASDGERVFVTTADGRLVAIDPGTETVAWTYDAGSAFGSSGPVVDSGMVYVAADEVYAFDVTGATPTWTTTTFGGTAGSTPIVHNGRVFVGSADGSLYALETDGTVAWTYETRDAIASSPTPVDGRIVVGSLDGSVYVLDETSGALTTTAYLDVPIFSSPVDVGGDVYLAIPAGSTGEGDVAALALELDQL